VTNWSHVKSLEIAALPDVAIIAVADEKQEEAVAALSRRTNAIASP
jgi:hypothetical protein